MSALIASARKLLGAARRKPSQADLRRTISTAYYAAFDPLARLCADQVVGTSPAKRRLPEWGRVYRALNHGRSVQALKELRTGSGQAVDPLLEDFCASLESMRLLRLDADYDPSPLKLKRSDVALLVDEVEMAIAKLGDVDASQKRRFASCACWRRER